MNSYVNRAKRYSIETDPKYLHLVVDSIVVIGFVIVITAILTIVV